MQKKSTIAAIILLALIWTTVLPHATLARVFDPHNIITDTDLFDADALSQRAIQAFLEREKSPLATYRQKIDGKNLRASEIIWKIAHEHSVNPKFLLTTLEKEQALISRGTATTKALDWATGFGCYGGTCREQYKGFYNQVEAAAITQESYRKKASQFNYKVGETTKTLDGFQVTPQNQATANLYIYTPYVGHSPELGVTKPYGGNRLFWRIWHRYFSNQPYLDGQILTDGERYWLIKDGKKWLFESEDVFLQDYTPNQAILIAQKYLDAYPDGLVIEFANRSVVQARRSGQLFVLEDFVKRPIENRDALAVLTDVRIATDDEQRFPVVNDQVLTVFPTGPQITTRSVYPTGKLFNATDGSLWFIKDGLRAPVDPAVAAARFKTSNAERISQDELSQYPETKPLKLPDGTFVIADGKYYLITRGARMRIDDITVIDRFFGSQQRTNAIKVSAAVLDIHDAGEVIDYIDDTITGSDTPDTNNDRPESTKNAADLGFSAKLIRVAPENIESNTKEVLIRVRNAGKTTWEPEAVWLTMTNTDGSASDLGAPNKILFSQKQVKRLMTASFRVPINASAVTDSVKQRIAVMARIDGTTYTLLESAVDFSIQPSGPQAEILSHTLPEKIKRDAKPVSVVMKIKNTSKDTIWLSRRTALEVYNTQGQPSVFYDPKDWIRKEVAAVPINKTQIKPGETGEFKFTLDATGVRRGEHSLVFRLKMLDKNGQSVLLDNQESFNHTLTVY